MNTVKVYNHRPEQIEVLLVVDSRNSDQSVDTGRASITTDEVIALEIGFDPPYQLGMNVVSWDGDEVELSRSWDGVECEGELHLLFQQESKEIVWLEDTCDGPVYP